jgi:hypothetical protein
MSQYVDYVVGLDLGQPQAYSALCVLEEPCWVPDEDMRWRMHAPTTGWVAPAALYPSAVAQPRSQAYHQGRPAKPPLHVRHLERFPLGTAYPQIAAMMRDRLATAPLSTGATALLIDQTGVGDAVVDLFRQVGLEPRTATVTGGDQVQVEGPHYRVPKRELVAAMQAVLQTERLKVAAALPEAAVLTRELLSFQLKPTTLTPDDYGAWRDGPQDDLVLAAALAVWWREWWSVHLDAAYGAYARQSA